MAETPREFYSPSLRQEKPICPAERGSFCWNCSHLIKGEAMNPAITVWEIKCGSVKDTTFMQGQRKCLFPTAYLHDVN